MSAKEMIQEQKVKAQSVVDGFVELEAQLDLDLQAKYDEGFAAGKASMGGEGDKLYSQAELDAIVGPINESLVAKEGQITQLQSDMDLLRAGIDAQVSAKVGEEIGKVIAEFDAQQSDESAKEGAFREFLVSKAPTPAPVE